MLNLDSAVGIEFRERELILAGVVKGFQGYHLKCCRVVEGYREMAGPELHALAIDFLESNGLDRDNIIVGLPRDEVLIREMELPLEAEENLDQVLKFQVDKLQPVEDETSCWDFEVVERDQASKKITVQVFMVPSELLDRYLGLLRELDLYPRAVRVSTVGLLQVLSIHKDLYPEKSPYLLLEIQPDAVELIVLFSKNRFVSERIRMKEIGLERILEEVDRFVSHMDWEGEEFSEVYIAEDRSDHYSEALRDHFGGGAPLREGVTLPGLGTVQRQEAPWVAAVGLALSGMNKLVGSGLNLIPADKRVVAERASMIPTMVLAALFVVMGFFVVVREYIQERQFLAQIEAQIQVLQPRVDRIMDLRARRDEMRKEFDELGGLMSGQQKVLLVLKELTERIPDGSYLQNINIQGNKISLTGFSDSASSLLKILLESDQLTGVESRYITPDRTQKDREKFSFEATVLE